MLPDVGCLLIGCGQIGFGNASDDGVLADVFRDIEEFFERHDECDQENANMGPTYIHCSRNELSSLYNGADTLRIHVVANTRLVDD